MVNLSKEKFYRTVKIEFGDLLDKEKDYFWVELREPKTRLMTDYQKILTSLAKSDAVRDAKPEELKAMTEEQRLEYASNKIGAQLDATVELLVWIEDHFSEVFENSNVYRNEKESASADEVKDVLFSSFAISSRLLNEYTSFLNNKK